MILYYFRLSPYSQKVLVAMYEMQLQLTLEHIDLFSKDAQEQAKWQDLQKRYTLSKLPLLYVKNEYIGESNNIVELLSIDNNGALSPQTGHAGRLIHYFSNIADNYITEPARRIIFQLQRPREERNTELIKRAEATLGASYELLEQQLQKTGQFITQGGFSLADCALFPALQLAHRFYPIAQQYSAIAHYLQTHSERPSILAMQSTVTGSQ